MSGNKTPSNKVVSQEEWLKAQRQFLAKEKEFTHMRDELSRQRRALPWRQINKNYMFDSPSGRKSLADLFEGRSQLIVQHFMFAPDWQEGCDGCSFMADHIEGTLAHLPAKDVTFAAVSRAPLAKIQAFQKRMGWSFPWYSSNDSDFNYDFNVSFTDKQKADGKVFYNFGDEAFSSEELPGCSVFFKNEKGEIFHTYSSYARGAEMVLTTYMLLDIVPKGRDEEGFKVHPMEWVRHHDKYDQKEKTGCCH